MSMIVVDLPTPEFLPVTFDLPGLERMDDAAFAAFCDSQPELRIEMDRNGNLIVMPPVEPESGNKELRIGAQVQSWSDRDGRGVAFSSSTMFTLPNGAKRSPDASWTTTEAMERLRRSGESKGYARHCPFFVVELRSATDRLPPLLAKMEESDRKRRWARDPHRSPGANRWRIYRPGREPESLARPAQVSAEPEMPGLILDLTKIW